jgi:transposase
MSRYDLTDFDWYVIEPLLPNRPRGVPRVDNRRVLNGIFWVLRSGAPWRDLPERYGPSTTCYNRFVRWRRAGVWDRLMDAITVAHDGDIQIIDSTSVRVHQQASTAKRGVQITVSVAPGTGSRITSRPRGIGAGNPALASASTASAT